VVASTYHQDNIEENVTGGECNDVKCVGSNRWAEL